MSSVGCDQVLGRECRAVAPKREKARLGFYGGRGCVGDEGFFYLGSIWKSLSMASKILLTERV